MHVLDCAVIVEDNLISLKVFYQGPFLDSLWPVEARGLPTALCHAFPMRKNNLFRAVLEQE
jgi:hypothetical protein